MKKPTKPKAKRLSQVEKDNLRVPRDWANDPAWLRDLRRTWENLGDGDDLVCAFRLDEPGCMTSAEFDRLGGQVAFVLGEYDDVRPQDTTGKVLS